jgi:hypothetical protein
MKRLDCARAAPAAAATAALGLLLWLGGGQLPAAAFAQADDARPAAAMSLSDDARPDAAFDAAAARRIPLAQLDAMLPADARLRLFTITDRPGLYVLHAPSLAEQGAMFTRVVTLLERRDMPRDRIVTLAAIAEHARRFDTDPAGLTAGNNFSATELAHFFEVARLQHLTLTGGERRLEALLAGWGLIRDEGGVWRARSERDFLITIPGLGPAPGGGTIDATVRAAILSHELGHWRYFSDPAYARACRTFWWHDLSYSERTELTRQLANVGYDPSDRIVIDETQAYLLHTPAAYIPIADTPGAYGIDVASVRKRLEARVAQAGR